MKMPCISILRPLNCILALFSVILGYFSTSAVNTGVSTRRLLFAGLSAFFIAAFGNVVNDVLDVEADAVNRPDRPIPSGRMDRHAAVVYCIVLLFCGLVFARLVSVQYFLMAFIVAGLLWFYSVSLKRIMLAGNVLVAGITGFTLVYGGLLSPDWKRSLIPAGFAFILNLIRELVKTASDRAGDKKAGLFTLAVRYGETVCFRGAFILLLLLILLTPLPWFLGIYNKVYLDIVVAGVNFPAVVILYLLRRRTPDAGTVRLVSIILKLMMVIGMAAILAGKKSFSCASVFNL